MNDHTFVDTFPHETLGILCGYAENQSSAVYFCQFRTASDLYTNGCGAQMLYIHPSTYGSFLWREGRSHCGPGGLFHAGNHNRVAKTSSVPLPTVLAVSTL